MGQMTVIIFLDYKFYQIQHTICRAIHVQNQTSTLSKTDLPEYEVVIEQ